MKKLIGILIIILSIGIIVSNSNAAELVDAQATPTYHWGPSEEDQKREHPYGAQFFLESRAGKIPVGAKCYVGIDHISYVVKGWSHVLHKKDIIKMLKQGEITCVSLNPDIIEVDSHGFLKAKKRGLAKVAVNWPTWEGAQPGSDEYGYAEVVVRAYKREFVLNKISVSIKSKKTKMIKIKDFPANAIDKAKFSISNKSVAKLIKPKQDCVTVKGLKKGKAVLKSKVFGKTLKCRIVVK